MRDVDGVAARQRDLAVDAGAGIPARMVLARVSPHGHSVGATEGDKRRGVDAEAQVAVIPAAGAPPVDEDLRTGHDAVEIEVDAAAGVSGSRRENGTVPADAAPGKLARATVGVGVERPGDRPVVRDAHRLPGAVIEGGGRCVERGVGVALEAPTGVESVGRALGADRCGAEREPCCQDMSHRRGVLSSRKEGRAAFRRADRVTTARTAAPASARLQLRRLLRPALSTYCSQRTVPLT
ncbi:MAG: hypothetical protein BWX70_01994 [Verrucomicrobia bacterium ADurb.Bin070]|nr:MAG: hypothetical protein BWX70_01994 [Verrucomicrobia bacterium ADurb.Bin070]